MQSSGLRDVNFCSFGIRKIVGWRKRNAEHEQSGKEAASWIPILNDKRSS